MRVRLFYERRGGACFVPHIALAPLFARAASRAGLSLERTQGFSPHPRMSFAPELPAGVVALNEPVDIYLKNYSNPDDLDLLNLKDLPGRWNAALPAGFRVLRAIAIENDAPALGKSCQAALYYVRSAGALNRDALCERARAYYGEAVLQLTPVPPEWLSLTLSEPAKSQNGIGGWVRKMTGDGDIAGWHEIHIVRAAIGPLSTLPDFRYSL